MTYYEILGVPEAATREEIQKAYRELALKYHPDRNKDADAGDRFRKINEAWDTLKDEVKRNQYDKRHERSGKEWTFKSSPYSESIFTSWQELFRSIDPASTSYTDIFETIFDSKTRTKTSERSTSPKKGDDMAITVNILLADTLESFESEIDIERQVLCSACQGRKQDKPCPECLSLGRTNELKTLKFRAPGGLVTGTTLKLPKVGHCGWNGGVNGDVYITVNVMPHSIFKRKGLHLMCTWTVDFVDAILGTTLKIKLPNSKEVNCRVPEGAQPGDVCTVKGCGFPDLQNPLIKGDLKVRLQVKLPKRINAKQREILTQYKKQEVPC